MCAQVRLRRLGVRRKEAALAQRYSALFEQWRAHLQGACNPFLAQLPHDPVSTMPLRAARTSAMAAHTPAPLDRYWKRAACLRNDSALAEQGGVHAQAV
jgi:hypothetical protein